VEVSKRRTYRFFGARFEQKAVWYGIYRNNSDNSVCLFSCLVFELSGAEIAPLFYWEYLKVVT
jgi:hypothetical protein